MYIVIIFLVIIALGIIFNYFLSIIKINRQYELDFISIIILGLILFVTINLYISTFSRINLFYLCPLLIIFMSKKIHKILRLKSLFTKYKTWLLISFLSVYTLVSRSNVEPTFVDSIYTHIPLVNILRDSGAVYGFGKNEPYMVYGNASPYVSAATYLNLNEVQYYGIFNIILSLILIIFLIDALVNKRHLFNLAFIISSYFLTYSILFLHNDAWLVTPNHDITTAYIFIISINYYIYIFASKVKVEQTHYYITILIFFEAGVFRTQWLIWGAIFMILFLCFQSQRNISYVKLFVLIMMINAPSMILRFIYTGHMFYPLATDFMSPPWAMTVGEIRKFMGESQIDVARSEFARGAFQADAILRLFMVSVLLRFIIELITQNRTTTSTRNKTLILIINVCTVSTIIFWWFTIPILRYVWGPLLVVIALNFALTIERVKLNPIYHKTV